MLAITVAPVASTQSASAYTDPNQRNAKHFTPEIVKGTTDPNQRSASDSAPH